MIPTLDAFTFTQKRLILLLDDGIPHSKADLLLCLDDSLAKFGSILKHLTFLRKILRPAGMDIIPQYVNRQIYYRLIHIHTPTYLTEQTIRQTAFGNS